MSDPRTAEITDEQIATALKEADAMRTIFAALAPLKPGERHAVMSAIRTLYLGKALGEEEQPVVDRLRALVLTQSERIKELLEGYRELRVALHALTDYADEWDDMVRARDALTKWGER